MVNLNKSRSFAILVLGVVLASEASAASYSASSTGAYSLLYGPLMNVSITGVPTATASQTGTGSAQSSSSGTYVASPTMGIVFPQTTTGSWLASASGLSGANGTATSEATFDFTMFLTNLAPGPNAYKLTVSYADFASYFALPPNQTAGVFSITEGTQTSLVAGNNTYTDVIYKSSIANGPGGTFRSRGTFTFSALMLPLQTDTLTINVDVGGYATATPPMGAPEPPPLFLGGLGLAAVARRRFKRKRAPAT